MQRTLLARDAKGRLVQVVMVPHSTEVDVTWIGRDCYRGLGPMALPLTAYGPIDYIAQENLAEIIKLLQDKAK